MNRLAFIPILCIALLACTGDLVLSTTTITDPAGSVNTSPSSVRVGWGDTFPGLPVTLEDVTIELLVQDVFFRIIDNQQVTQTQIKMNGTFDDSQFWPNRVIIDDSVNLYTLDSVTEANGWTRIGTTPNYTFFGPEINFPNSVTYQDGVVYNNVITVGALSTLAIQNSEIDLPVVLLSNPIDSELSLVNSDNKGSSLLLQNQAQQSSVALVSNSKQQDDLGLENSRLQLSVALVSNSQQDIIDGIDF